ncbi:hypothetical protein BDF19DRAFT_422034 [Syncephalis fuscata]|nr:hypothetical protein BDF19DRAFT_422034 [Syncephalis fuscata]
MLTSDEEDNLFEEFAFTQAPFDITPVATTRTRNTIRPSTKRRRKQNNDEFDDEYEEMPLSSHSNNTTACPICCDTFDIHSIEAHVADCQVQEPKQDTTGICPVCGLSFPLATLEQHVNEELGQLDAEDEDIHHNDGSTNSTSYQKDESLTIISNPHSSTSNNINDINNIQLAELQDLDQSIFISDDEHDDWFDDRPSGLEILSQQQQQPTTPPFNSTIRPIAIANTTSTSRSTTRSNNPGQYNEEILLSGQLSPIEGLINLHEARTRFPELEGYFNQFSIEPSMPSNTTSNEFNPLDYSSTTTTTTTTSNTSYSRGSKNTFSYRGRATQNRSSRGRGNNRSWQNNRTTYNNNNNNNNNNNESTFNHYAGDPAVIDTDQSYGLQWEGEGYTNW